jgi:hypothetical protein
MVKSSTFPIFNFSNVHLPADQSDDTTGENKDRTKARKRDLDTVVSKLQVLGQLQNKSIPFILGDINSGQEDSMFFKKSFFIDARLHPSNAINDQDGFTFYWKRNRRADKNRKHGHQEKSPRITDRIFFGNQQALVPTIGTLLGDQPRRFPPSDHFGVSVSFDVHQNDGCMVRPIIYDPEIVEHNAWATSAIPTTDSLLVLVFENQVFDGSSTKHFYPASTLHDTIRCVSASQFLHGSAYRLGIFHKYSKIRMRVSSINCGPALYIITVKLAPSLPFADILLARTFFSGFPVDIPSQYALDSIEDVKTVLLSVQDVDEAAFQGAVRVIKLWTHRRQIYDSSIGYLGGEAWAVLLAWVLKENNDLRADLQFDDVTIASREITFYFEVVVKHGHCRIGSCLYRSRIRSKEYGCASP